MVFQCCDPLITNMINIDPQQTYNMVHAVRASQDQNMMCSHWDCIQLTVQSSIPYVPGSLVWVRIPDLSIEPMCQCMVLVAFTWVVNIYDSSHVAFLPADTPCYVTEIFFQAVLKSTH